MPYRYMLDTNTVSQAVSKRSPHVLRHLRKWPLKDLCVSAIAFGEVQFGLADKPEATRLAETTADLFAEIDVLPWTEETARVYGQLRASMKRGGKSLSPLDMLIAAHALATGATLVTADRAFRHVPNLDIDDWSV